MKRLEKRWYVVTLLMIFLLLFAGCSGGKENVNDADLELVNVSVERTGGLINGIGKVMVYIDGEEVMKVKNNETESIELHLSPGVHTIQTKGQGDKSDEVEFEVIAGQDNTFTYQTEISNIYGVKLE